MPEGKKGAGKFYRNASPGSWRNELTPEQVRIVEKETAALMEEFYSDGANGTSNSGEAVGTDL